MEKNNNELRIKMKTRRSYLWNLLRIFFPSVEMDKMWLTFGKTIWTPGSISNDLLCHEMVHVYQQKNFFNAILWWIKYIRDPKFRYSQELPAYKAQYKFLCKTLFKDKNQRGKLRYSIAMMMSGPHYNNMVEYNKVYKELE